jgi:serine/threonine protein kinase
MAASPEPMPPSGLRPTPDADPDASRYQAEPSTASGDPDASCYEPPLPGSASERKLPRRFGDYELVEEIARGGMGVVFKARQLKAGGRKVALKMILGGEQASTATLERFQREASLLASIDHPGIVPVYEVGAVDGQPFYSMALVEGGSLQQRLQTQGPLEPRVAARLIRQVAEAVQHAHENNVIHRDIKPHNILLQVPERKPRDSPAETATGSVPTIITASRAPESSPRLTDFGLARTREGGGSVTGEQLGTPSYMAPEQAAGQVREIGPATDVYGLGAVLYCALTGRPPFQSSSAMETMRQVLEQEPVPLRQLNPAVPHDLETVCLKCLEKTASRRYASAQELAEELGRFERGEPVRARPVGRLERTWRWCRRYPAVAALALAVGWLLLLGTSVSWLLALRAASEADRARQKERHALDEKDRADREAKESQRLREIMWRMGEAKRVDEELKEARKGRFAGVALTGKRVIFLVDTSGSMKMVDERTPAPAKWGEVCVAVVRVMRSLPDLERFQVISFGEESLFPLGGPGEWLDYDVKTSADRVGMALARIKPRGGTNMFKPMEAAFRYRAKGLDALYLFSDGLPNEGEGLTPEQDKNIKDELQRSALLGKFIRRKLANDWNRPIPGEQRVRINTIGFFYETPEVGTYLWALARENEGGFVGMSKP